MTDDLNERRIEQLIASDPDSLEPYLVYADWLQERGDTLGDLIALAHRVSQDPARYGDGYWRFLYEHAEQMLGPVSRWWTLGGGRLPSEFVFGATTFLMLARDIAGSLESLTIAMHMGFVHRLRIPRNLADDLDLRDVLSRPLYRFVRELDIIARPAGRIRQILEGLSETQRQCLEVIALYDSELDTTDADALAALPRLESLTIAEAPSLTDDMLRRLASARIRNVELNHCSSITANGLRASLHEDLTGLGVEGHPNLADDALLEALGTCRKLERLTLGASPELSVEALHRLSHLSLQTLTLLGSPPIDSVLVGVLADIPELRRVFVYPRDPAQSPISELSSHSLMALGANIDAPLLDALCNLRALPGFQLTAESHLDMVGLQRVTRSPHVRGLIFTDSPLAQRDTLRQVATLGSQLTKLTIHGAPSLTDDDFAFLESLSGLRALSLVDVPALTGAVMQHLRSLSKLEELQLPAMDLDDSELEVLGALSALTVLLLPCPLTDEGMESVLRSLPDLTELLLTGPGSLSDSAADRIIDHGIARLLLLDLDVPRKTTERLRAANVEVESVHRPEMRDWASDSLPGP